MTREKKYHISFETASEFLKQVEVLCTKHSQYKRAHGLSQTVEKATQASILISFSL